MKLRATFLPLIVVAALTSAVGFKSPKKQDYQRCTFIYNDPVNGPTCLGYSTDQDDCDVSNTGPVCTTTNGLGTFTAYYGLNGTDYLACQNIFRQP